MKIIKEYKGKASRKRAIIETEFGFMDIDLINFNRGHTQGIVSAIDKTAYFQKQLDKIHNFKFKVLGTYINAKTKILINDGIGNCLVRPKSLLRGIGTGIAGSVNPTEYFISKAKSIHKNIYTYDRSVYKSIKEPITITCSVHGDFKQIPHSHLKGSGCALCGKQVASSKRMTYTKGVDKGIVYILELQEGDGTIFYKIGFTKHSVGYRYHKKWFTKTKTRKMPYECKKFLEIVLPLEEAKNKEKELHKLLGKYHYKPIMHFDGAATECYLKNEEYEIISERFGRGD